MIKRPGRPRLDPADVSVPVHVTMTATQYDAVYRRATDARVTVPEIIRRDVAASQQKKNAK